MYETSVVKRAGDQELTAGYVRVDSFSGGGGSLLFVTVHIVVPGRDASLDTKNPFEDGSREYYGYIRRGYFLPSCGCAV